MKIDLKACLLLCMLVFYSLPGMAQIVVVASPQSATNSLTSDQVSQVYLGISTNFTPIDQPDSSPIRGEFYKKVTGKEPSQVKAIWSKLVFTGKGKLPKEYPSSADVKKAVSADPNAIGYIEKSAVDGSVKVLLTIP